MIKDRLQEIIEAKKQKNKHLQELLKNEAEEIKVLLISSCEAIFKEFPDLHGIRWYQFTPYFMDGDPCVFGIDEISFSFKENQTIENEEIYAEDFLTLSEFPTSIRNIYDEIISDLLQNIPYLYKDELEYAFGDHCCITIYSDLKIEVSKYTNHD